MKLFNRRPSFSAVGITIAVVAVCSGLGVWQLQRMNWKQEKVALIETRAHAEPVALPAKIDEAADWEYRVVAVTGRFRHDQESYRAARSAKGPFGYQVITALERDVGKTVLVNRGWIPSDNLEPSTRLEGQIAGDVTVTGLVRLPWYRTKVAGAVQNDRARHIYFEGALEEMAAAHNIDALPIFVDADETPNPGGWPRGGQTVLKLTDNHLIYAIQWFLFGLVAMVIFVVYHRQKEG